MLGKLELFFVGILLAGSVFSAGSPVRVNDATLGVNIVPASESTWKSRLIKPLAQVSESDYKERPGEFFELEYGAPLAAFAFTNGTVRTWGCTRLTPDEPGVRFGRGWGGYPLAHWAIVADVEQDGEVSDWTLQTRQHQYDGRIRDVRFAMPGGQRANCFVKMGKIEDIGDDIGITLRCVSTNGVKGTVHALRFVCYELPVSYRKKFTLEKLPAFAGCTVPHDPYGVLTVNGQVVARGVRVRNRLGLIRREITKCLKVGENEFVFTKDAVAGWGGLELSSYAEFFTVADDGTTTVYGSGADWEARIGDGAWGPVKPLAMVGDRRLPAPSNKQYCGVSNPMHAGALQVSPKKIPYPVFDEKEENIWSIWYPKGIKDAKVEVEVRDALTGAPTLSTTEISTDNSSICFTGLKSGAYEITWTLASAGKPIDTQKTEMVVAGPIGGKAYPLEEMEKELQKRKRLVGAIDAASPQYDEISTNFIGHSGGYVSPKRIVTGRVIKEAGRLVRETDPTNSSYFAWHIPVGTLGKAHLIEVDYPDTREQLIYSSVLFNYPLAFSGNGYPFDGAYANASGAVKTGDRTPLSGKIKTLRYVFYPGSRNATVLFDSGLRGKPACCAAIRVYEIDGGLPAWDAPKSERVYMNHNERALYGHWGAAVNPAILNGQLSSHMPRMWAAAYLAACNRIEQLRFFGHNAAIEGAYMYMQCFPTMSGESYTATEDFDIFYLTGKLYARNGIKLFAGFEYSSAPSLRARGLFDVSEREIWAGKKDGAYRIDREGRVTTKFGGMSGVDDSNPIVRQSMTNLLSEIYMRYSNAFPVEGLYVICGGGWLPGYVHNRGQKSAEIGYGDAEIRDFERDTGIRLGTNGRDRNRFARRYELLTGRYAKAWLPWRAKRMRQTLEELKTVVTSGKSKWRVLAVVMPEFPQDNPFASLSSRPDQRDAFLKESLCAAGFDPAVYGNGSGIELVPTVSYATDLEFTRYGAFANRESRALYRKMDAVYYTPAGLDERRNWPVKIPPGKWWWTTSREPVYCARHSDEGGYLDFVDICSEYTPKTMVHTWLDCNHVTSHDAACRAFLNGFYSTPVGPEKQANGVTGVDAHVYGDKLQLVNNTPYPVSDAKMVIPAFGIVVLDKIAPHKFRFAKVDESRILEQGRTILADRRIVGRTRPETTTALEQAVYGNDAYRTCVLLRDWEIESIVRRAVTAGESLKNQKVFEDELRTNGTVHINCGSIHSVRAGKARTLWLKDQPYSGFGAYGDEFARYHTRSSIKVVGAGEETDWPYKTEAGGSDALAYHLPVPDGEYAVTLYIANTWSDNPGRPCRCSVNGVEKIIDPWGPPNPCKYGAHNETWTGLNPNRAGEIVVEIQDCPILNGIRVRRKQ